MKSLIITILGAALIFDLLWKFYQVAAWKAGLITLGVVVMVWGLIIVVGLLFFMWGMGNLH